MQNEKPISESLYKKAINGENDKLLREIAYSHGSKKSFIALFGKERFTITPEQKKEALRIFIDKVENKYEDSRRDVLIFVEMGMDFKPTIKGGIGNHRIRTHFINNDGIECFLEIGSNNKNMKYFRIDHALTHCNKQEPTRLKEENEQNFTYKYTFGDVLKFVNKTFNCDFKKIKIDGIYLRCDRVLSISPQFYKTDIIQRNQTIRLKKGFPSDNQMFNLSAMDKAKYLQHWFSLGYGEDGNLSLMSNALMCECWSNGLNISDDLDLILTFFGNQGLPYILDEGRHKNKLLKLLYKYKNKLFLSREDRTGSFMFHYYPTENYKERYFYPLENGIYLLEQLEGVTY